MSYHVAYNIAIKNIQNCMNELILKFTTYELHEHFFICCKKKRKKKGRLIILF